jgi:hypothetical protein
MGQANQFRARRAGDPEPTDAAERSAWITRAARLVREQYPGPAGLVLSRELAAFDDIGPYVGAADSLMWGLIRQVLDAPPKGQSDGST